MKNLWFWNNMLAVRCFFFRFALKWKDVLALCIWKGIQNHPSHTKHNLCKSFCLFNCMNATWKLASHNIVISSKGMSYFHFTSLCKCPTGTLYEISCSDSVLVDYARTPALWEFIIIARVFCQIIIRSFSTARWKLSTLMTFFIMPKNLLF